MDPFLRMNMAIKDLKLEVQKSLRGDRLAMEMLKTSMYKISKQADFRKYISGSYDSKKDYWKEQKYIRFQKSVHFLMLNISKISRCFFCKFGMVSPKYTIHQSNIKPSVC